MSLLYKEHCENNDMATSTDVYMREIESLMNARRRGLMTDTEYQIRRTKQENLMFSSQLAIENKLPKNDKNTLELCLNDIYALLKNNSMDSKGAQKGTFRHTLTFLLEEINMKLDIPFND